MTIRGVGRSSRWLDGKTRRSVAVHTTGGQSLTGVLVTVAADVLVLRHARILDPHSGGTPPLDGDVAVPKSRVAFVQVLAAGDVGGGGA